MEQNLLLRGHGEEGAEKGGEQAFTGGQPGEPSAPPEQTKPAITPARAKCA